MFNDFYEIDSEGYMTQFYAPCPILLTERYIGKNSALKLLYGIYEDFDFPLTFKQEKSYGGKKMTDFLNTGWGGVLTPISDKVLKLLRDNNITGWKTYPIRVFEKNNVEIQGDHGFSITGRCRDLDLTIWKEKIDYQYRDSGPIYHYWKGFPLDLSTWDGSDIFLLAGTAHAFINKRVFSIFKNAKVSNIKYKNVGDFIVMGHDLEKDFVNKVFKQKESYTW